MRRRWVTVGMLGLATVALLAAGCSDDSAPPAASGGSTIAVRDYEFVPGTLSVEVGQTVTWVWESQAQHNVVGDGFESADQSSGSFRQTFDSPGTYRYGCAIHPGMEGEVVVTERGA